MVCGSESRPTGTSGLSAPSPGLGRCSCGDLSEQGPAGGRGHRPGYDCRVPAPQPGLSLGLRIPRVLPAWALGSASWPWFTELLLRLGQSSRPLGLCSKGSEASRQVEMAPSGVGTGAVPSLPTPAGLIKARTPPPASAQSLPPCPQGWPPGKGSPRGLRKVPPPHSQHSGRAELPQPRSFQQRAARQPRLWGDLPCPSTAPSGTWKHVTCAPWFAPPCLCPAWLSRPGKPNVARLNPEENIRNES